MNDIRDTVLQLLLAVAPEASDVDLAPDEDLRERLDIDSMDQLSFLSSVADRFHVDIPERDYPDLVSLDAIAAYVAARRS